MSGENFLDPEWYRVAALRPRLRAHVRLHRHRYRGQVWHVAQDAVTGRFHRFSLAAWSVIGLMDGERDLDAIWTRASEQLGDNAPTQREVIRLLHQLHVAELLRTNLVPDAAELADRGARQRRAKFWQTLRTPLAIRVPLFDPERLLQATQWVADLIFTRRGLYLWLLCMFVAGAVVISHWNGLTENLSERLLTPNNLLMVWLLFPLVKILHEFGHAWAVKRWGGEVHEMGMMLLVFTPVPYVDASQSSALNSKSRRAIVGLAGMMMELVIAAIALFVWAIVEPGLLRTVCYNIMAIAGVSTILFNGNPLLRFDAYYVLSDLLEIPNLANRSNQYIYYLIHRYGFGVRDAESPANVPSERGWFVFYSIASLIFRLVLYFSIILFIANRYFLIGIVLAFWSLWNLLFSPMSKALKFLATSPRLARQRPRAVAVSTSAFSALFLLLTVVPLPYATVGQGVLWVPEDAIVRAAAPGLVEHAPAASELRIEYGAPIVKLEDPLLDVEVAVHQAEVDALLARFDYFEFTDRSQANIAREQLAGAREVLARAAERQSALTVTSPATGKLVYVGGVVPSGNFIERGSNLAYVLTDATPRIKAVIPQSAVDVVRRSTTRVSIRLVQDLHAVRQARILRITPAGTTTLPSPALGSSGGGAIASDPRDEKQLTAIEPIFELDLEITDGEPVGAVGTRVYIRFDHGYEALAYRWYRDLRRLFLSQFDV